MQSCEGAELAPSHPSFLQAICQAVPPGKMLFYPTPHPKDLSAAWAWPPATQTLLLSAKGRGVGRGLTLGGVLSSHMEFRRPSEVKSIHMEGPAAPRVSQLSPWQLRSQPSTAPTGAAPRGALEPDSLGKDAAGAVPGSEPSLGHQRSARVSPNRSPYPPWVLSCCV